MERDNLMTEIKSKLEAASEMNIRRFCIEQALMTPTYTKDGNKGYENKEAVIATAQAYYDFITGKEVKNED